MEVVGIFAIIVLVLLFYIFSLLAEIKSEKMTKEYWQSTAKYYYERCPDLEDFERRS